MASKKGPVLISVGISVIILAILIVIGLYLLEPLLVSLGQLSGTDWFWLIAAALLVYVLGAAGAFAWLAKKLNKTPPSSGGGGGTTTPVGGTTPNPTPIVLPPVPVTSPNPTVLPPIPVPGGVLPQPDVPVVYPAPVPTADPLTTAWKWAASTIAFVSNSLTAADLAVARAAASAGNSVANWWNSLSATDKDVIVAGAIAAAIAVTAVFTAGLGVPAEVSALGVAGDWGSVAGGFAVVSGTVLTAFSPVSSAVKTALANATAAIAGVGSTVANDVETVGSDIAKGLSSIGL